MIRIGLACAGVLLMLQAGFAQTDAPPQAGQTPPASVSSSPPAAAPAPQSVPPEISHEEMVKEQERRDREEEAERDRDDQG